MDIQIRKLEIAAYKVPTDSPESDGTLEWDSTTLVLVRVLAADHVGLGYTYAHEAVAVLVHELLRPCIEGGDALAVQALHDRMRQQGRNLGHPGIVAMAISAVDSALWDLKAKLLNLPLVRLLGAVRDSIPVYGSGGFTSYDIDRLQEQLAGWMERGISRVKMKVGRDPDADLDRVRLARQAIGPHAELFVDANGAYDRKQALDKARRFAEHGVTWFEEPVSSDDLEGLRLLRDRAPAGMEITAGEYGYSLFYFRRMLESGAVDVLQPDMTRCGGVTGFREAGVLCQACALPLSAHTAPALHAHVCCAVPAVRHAEYFHDHVRIEELFFEGVPSLVNGSLRPDLARPGYGLELKSADVERYLIWKA